MNRLDGSLARTLDFGDTASAHRFEGRLATDRRMSNDRPTSGRLALLRGPNKYLVLDRRRRAAQIRARHVLDLIDVMERAEEGRS